MATKLIFLRHGETVKDLEVESCCWSLSEAGRRQAREVADRPVMNEAEAINTSNELKAYQTAEPLAAKLDLSIKQDPAFDEVKRGGGFFSESQFIAEKNRQLSDLSYRAFGEASETGLEALERFRQGIKRVIERSPDRTILIVSHGTILSIYFAQLLDKLDELPERWHRTGFGAYGVVAGDRVVKDIVD